MAASAALPTLSAAHKGPFAGLARTGQVLGSFVAVVGAYCVYWLLAVPLIEPSLEEKPVAVVTDEQRAAARSTVSDRRSEVARYFSDDAWELKNPCILEGKQTRLLYKQLTPLKNGEVELKPCTLLFFPKSSGAAGSAPVQPIIMRAVQGATVRFDKPVELKSFEPGERELKGGHLAGPIRIYRSASGPGADDDLEITTRDVELVGERAWTPHPVNFRLGRNRGSGRELEIMLEPAAAGAAKTAIRAGSVRTLELKHDVKMHLEVGRAALAPAAAASKSAKPDPPIQITCQGPFQFDVERNSARFRDRVDVFRLNPTGASDQLNCEVLTVYFASASKPAPPNPTGPSNATSGLQVRLIEARGAPVTIQSPVQGIIARCEGLDYAPGVAGAPGTLVLGPGTMEGRMQGDSPASYDARWGREFRFEPSGSQHVATLRGDAQVRYAQTTSIVADEMFAWLTSKASPTLPPGVPPPAAPGEAWQLDHVVAQVYQDKNAVSRGAVVIESPQLHGVTAQLDATVDRPDAPASPPPGTGQSAPTPAASPAVAPQKPPQLAKSESTQRFDVRGRRIGVALVPEGRQLAISGLTIENGAHLEELTPKPGEKPLKVDGDRVEVTGAQGDATHIAIRGGSAAGRPARIEANGMTLVGGAIEMDKAGQRLWNDGPGQMTMPIEQDFNGQPIKRPALLTVNWETGMDFRIKTIVFTGQVVASSDQQYLTTDKLEATLTRPIDLTKRASPAAPGERPELARLRCFGPVLLKGRQLDEQARQTAVDTLHAYDMTLDRLTGDVEARGPGSLTHVGRRSPQVLEARTGAPAQQAPPAKSKRDPDALTYLHVDFQRSMTGNMNRRQVTFGDKTKTVYGPVESWEATLNADDPSGWGADGMVMNARQLTVREMPARNQSARGHFELEAQGNVVAEGKGFTARGDRLMYAEEKGQIVLRGDSYGPAEFFQEDPGGGPRKESAADELTYWTALQHVRVTGFKSFGLDAPKPPPSQKPVNNRAKALFGG